MTTSYICPDSTTCRRQHTCSDFITLEVKNQYVMWNKDFAITMVKHYQNYGIPYQIHRNCDHPAWQNEKSI
jgi:hypothetical protein